MQPITMIITCPRCDDTQTYQAVWDDDGALVEATTDLSTQPGWHWAVPPGAYDCGH